MSTSTEKQSRLRFGNKALLWGIHVSRTSLVFAFFQYCFAHKGVKHSSGRLFYELGCMGVKVSLLARYLIKQKMRYRFQEKIYVRIKTMGSSNRILTTSNTLIWKFCNLICERTIGVKQLVLFMAEMRLNTAGTCVLVATSQEML